MSEETTEWTDYEKLKWLFAKRKKLIADQRMKIKKQTRPRIFLNQTCNQVCCTNLSTSSFPKKNQPNIFMGFSLSTMEVENGSRHFCLQNYYLLQNLDQGESRLHCCLMVGHQPLNITFWKHNLHYCPDFWNIFLGDLNIFSWLFKSKCYVKFSSGLQ